MNLVGSRQLSETNKAADFIIFICLIQFHPTKRLFVRNLNKYLYVHFTLDWLPGAGDRIPTKKVYLYELEILSFSAPSYVSYMRLDFR